MSKIRDYLKSLKVYDQSWSGFDSDLRLDLSSLILQSLNARGWSQRNLAHKSGIPESRISNIVHGDQNWTCETAAKLLHALGVRPAILARDRVGAVMATLSKAMVTSEGTQDGKEIYGKGQSASNEVSYRFSDYAGAIQLSHEGGPANCAC